MKLALIGLGNMGSALARRLLDQNFDLTVFNRTSEKMQPLVKLGAKGAESLTDAVKEADVIITCLLDDKALLETLDKFINQLQPGTIHIGTSTILPETSKKITDIFKAHNCIYIAANVLGIPKVAEKGQLTSIIAGDPNAIEKCTTIFQAYSAKIIRAGSLPFHANVIKICVNYFLISAIEIMGELYTFAEKNQIELEILQELFHSVFAHPAFKLYIDKIKERNFDQVNFRLEGGFKDINLFQEAFTHSLVVPEIINVIKDKFIVALANNMHEKDWSALTEVTRMQSGLR